MRLRHIEVFYAVYRYRTISAAAAKLNVSSPAVSRALKHAEDTIGFPLFVRSGRGLAPTAEAHRLFNEAENVFHGIDRMRRLAREIDKAHGESLRVSAVTGLCFDLMPRAIQKLRKLEPHSHFEVQSLHYSDLVMSLRKFETDVGFVFAAREHQGIQREEVGSIEMVCLYDSSRLQLAKQRIKLKDILDEDLITLNPDGPLGRRVFEELTDFSEHGGTTAMAESCFVASCLAAGNIGVAIVDELTARANSFTNLTYRYFTPPIKVTVSALHLGSRSLSPLGQTLLKIYQAELQPSKHR